MKTLHKGKIQVSTDNTLIVTKSKNDTRASVMSDLKDAATSINFLGDNNQLVNFKFQNESETTLSFSMENFKGVSFLDSLKTAPEERQIMFKQWSMFWSRMTKLGYKIN